MTTERCIALFAAVAAASTVAACAPGEGTIGCAGGDEECGGACVDVSSDGENCGACGVACDTAAGEICVAGSCADPNACSPGASEPCYSGPVGTEGVGPCAGGTRSCESTGLWGPCVGEVTPSAEVCGNGVDENCNGAADEEADADADGFTTCQGDCCDAPSDGCTDPELVNPGAFDAVGNDLDDDCNGVIDDVVTACDTGLASSSGDPLDYARAMDLCQTAPEDPPPDQRAWGVISASFSLASGSGAPSGVQRSIRDGFGTGVAPQLGDALAVLSTGHAADQTDSDPSFGAFQGGQNMGTTSSVPMDWLAANGGDFPNAAGCPEPQGGTTANDPIMLTLRVRVPTNANSFRFSSNFFSSEYPEWVCSAFNDFFVVLLTSSFSGTPANPTDGNLASYTAPDSTEYPVGVNLAYGDTGLFSQCLNGPTGCGTGAVSGTTSTCAGTTQLAGTGFDVVNAPPQFPDDPSGCGGSNLAGGGTGWLVTSGNVVPGEIIELRIALWDTGDPWYDSVVLLDDFEWSVEVSEPGTVIE